METKDLKKKFPDLTVAKLTMDAVYSHRDIENIIKKSFGSIIVRYEHNAKKVNVATSQEYGKFINQLIPGAKVVMTGGEIKMNPEYEKKVWTIRTLPAFMCGEVVVWLDGFSGAYSCEMLRLPNCDEDLLL